MEAWVPSVFSIFIIACATQPPADAPEATSQPEPASSEPAEPAVPAPAAPTASAEPTPAAEEPEAGSALEKLMRAHFKETAVIRSSVIAGNTRDAVAPAQALSKMEGVETLPVDWKTPVQQLQAAADRIHSSPDVPEVAAATADIGVACANCHRKVGGGPKLEIGEAPDVGASVQSRMNRHVWATERLWEGLFVPSDAAWQAGAEALKEDPFPRDALKAGGVHARSSADEFVKLAREAGSRKTPTDRATLYSSLLTTCAACHVAMKK